MFCVWSGARIRRKANSFADLSFFESPFFYDLLQKAQQEAGYRPPWLLQQVGGMLRAAIGLVSMLIVLLAFQPLLALAVLLLALPSLLVQFRSQRQGWGLHAFEIPEVRFMAYFQKLLGARRAPRRSGCSAWATSFSSATSTCSMATTAAITGCGLPYGGRRRA